MKEICNFIFDFVEKYGYKGIVVGISGGLDSAVTAALCVKAIGSEKVFGLIMPERDSSKDTVKDAKLVCEWLKIPFKVKSITPILRKIGVYKLFPPARLFPRSFQERYVLNKWRKLSQDPFIDDLLSKGNDQFLKGLAFYRIKHRVRMCLLYFEAEQRGYAVASTENKTEYLTGLYVKWGDDCGDISPIAHLYKTQVFDLAKKLDVPEKIIAKAPSPDLIPGIDDEFALGMSYQELDQILVAIETGKDLSTFPTEKVNRVKKILEAAKVRNLRNYRIERFE
ncbi:NAD(+) synthase [Pseudothermotoga thermarum]|uniref:NAD(+) synthase n=1 Tax=Pseudothermotoga thermarum TaxID=119394 RepID=UPI00059C8A5F|nr:NAD(+) synthase [Pseudothermotoga thermarum]